MAGREPCKPSLTHAAPPPGATPPPPGCPIRWAIARVRGPPRSLQAQWARRGAHRPHPGARTLQALCRRSRPCSRHLGRRATRPTTRQGAADARGRHRAKRRSRPGAAPPLAPARAGRCGGHPQTPGPWPACPGPPPGLPARARSAPAPPLCRGRAGRGSPNRSGRTTYSGTAARGRHWDGRWPALPQAPPPPIVTSARRTAGPGGGKGTRPPGRRRQRGGSAGQRRLAMVGRVVAQSARRALGETPNGHPFQYRNCWTSSQNVGA